MTFYLFTMTEHNEFDSFSAVAVTFLRLQLSDCFCLVAVCYVLLLVTCQCI